MSVLFGNTSQRCSLPTGSPEGSANYGVIVDAWPVTERLELVQRLGERSHVSHPCLYDCA